MVKAQLGPESHLLDDLLLAPLLTTRDLLSLSATAPWLLSYRNLLRDIKVKTWHEGVVATLLTKQTRLQTMYVGTGMVLGRLTRSLRGEGGASLAVTLRRLIVGREEGEAPASEDDFRELGLWLAEGRCPLLEELDMSLAPRMDPAGAWHVCYGLKGCPELRSLQAGRSNLQVLAAALQHEICPKLEHLRLAGGTQGDALGGILLACPRPTLRDLHITSMNLGSNLGEALRSGACRGLKTLRLELVNFEATGVLAWGEAVAEGACPDLTVLSLTNIFMGPQWVHALAQVVRAGALIRLEELRITYSPIDDEGVVALAEALGEGGCPRLRDLRLVAVGMGKQGYKTIAKAVQGGGMPSLKRLDLWDGLTGHAGLSCLGLGILDIDLNFGV
jgi:hypothetical protein